MLRIKTKRLKTQWLHHVKTKQEHSVKPLINFLKCRITLILGNMNHQMMYRSWTTHHEGITGSMSVFTVMWLVLINYVSLPWFWTHLGTQYTFGRFLIYWNLISQRPERLIQYTSVCHASLHAMVCFIKSVTA